MPILKEITVIDHEATGKQLRLQRVRKGLQLKETAKRMGISLMYLSNLERGQRNWTEELVEKFQKALRK